MGKVAASPSLRHGSKADAPRGTKCSDEQSLAHPLVDCLVDRGAVHALLSPLARLAPTQALPVIGPRDRYEDLLARWYGSSALLTVVARGCSVHLPLSLQAERRYSRRRPWCAHLPSTPRSSVDQRQARWGWPSAPSTWAGASCPGDSQAAPRGGQGLLGQPPRKSDLETKGAGNQYINSQWVVCEPLGAGQACLGNILDRDQAGRNGGRVISVAPSGPIRRPLRCGRLRQPQPHGWNRDRFTRS